MLKEDPFKINAELSSGFPVVEMEVAHFGFPWITFKTPVLAVSRNIGQIHCAFTLNYYYE